MRLSNQISTQGIISMIFYPSLKICLEVHKKAILTKRHKGQKPF